MQRTNSIIHPNKSIIHCSRIMYIPELEKSSILSRGGKETFRAQSRIVHLQLVSSSFLSLHVLRGMLPS